jgi:hypothetical protein
MNDLKISLKRLIVVAMMQQSLLYAQPVDSPRTDFIFISKPFLQCVSSHNQFVSDYVSASPVGFHLNDTIYFQLNVPQGLWHTFQNIENSKKYETGLFDYTKADSIQIRFAFYLGHSENFKGAVSFRYNNHLDSSQSFMQVYQLSGETKFKSAIAQTYESILKELKAGTYRIYIVAQMAPVNVDQTKYETLATTAIYLMITESDLETYRKLHAY